MLKTNNIVSIRIEKRIQFIWKEFWDSEYQKSSITMHIQHTECSIQMGGDQGRLINLMGSVCKLYNKGSFLIYAWQNRTHIIWELLRYYVRWYRI